MLSPECAHDGIAPSINGTANPIVWFKQFNNVVSIPLGKGVSGVVSDVLAFAVSAVVSLYPSSVNTTLLAR